MFVWGAWGGLVGQKIMSASLPLPIFVLILDLCTYSDECGISAAQLTWFQGMGELDDEVHLFIVNRVGRVD